MNKTILTALLTVGVASTALADRGDRYGGGLPVPPGVPASLVPGNRHSVLPAPPIPHGLPVPPVPRIDHLPVPPVPVPAFDVHGRYSYGYHSYRPYPAYVPAPVYVPRPYCAPVYVAPPVYCAPPVVVAPVYAPAPVVYVRPAPVVYVRPAPVVVAEPAPVSGFSASYYGGSYGSGLSIGFSYYR